MKHVQGNNHNLKFVIRNACLDSLLEVFSSLPSGNERERESFALYVAHGMKYKPVAVQEYENSCLTGKHLLLYLKVLKPFLFLVHHLMLKLLTLNALFVLVWLWWKVLIPSFTGPPLEACSDPNFFMQKISDKKCILKRDHAYYAQVQGQMGVTGAKLCDFIVYTSNAISIERIAFDPVYRDDLVKEHLRY